MKLQNKDVIREGEKILWEGNPEPFGFISKPTLREVGVKCVLIPLISIVLGILNARSAGKLDMGLISVLIFVNAALIITAILKHPKVKAQHYLMTDQRVILMRLDEAYYIDLDKIDGFRVVTGKTDQPTVVFGKSIFPDIDSHLLWRACAAITRNVGTETIAEADAFVFFNIKNAAALETQLRKAGVTAA